MVVEIVKPGWVEGKDEFPIMSVDIHPHANKFATGGQGSDCGRIIIWNLEPLRNSAKADDPSVPKQLCQMENHLACVNCVRWSSDGKYLASAGDDKLVMLWTRSAYGGGAVFGGGGKVNHESYKCTHTLRQHDGDVLDLSWSPEDRWLASCSVDCTIIIWDVSVSNPVSVAVLRGHNGHVKGVTWDPVGKYLASQSADKTLRVWRTGDWKEETKVQEPFEDCGGTTHVLRLNWSPDGQYIVSAHAMNAGGPTAQIIERDGFKYEKDFVGHRKAVTCVRFNGNIFQQKSKKGKNNNYVCVAIGSRDRSISIWLTSLRRPLFVCHDLFESSILDLAWTKDGMTLIACSHDGQIAGINLGPGDLGKTMSVSEKNQLFKSLYGKTTGVAVSDKPVLIENAELLKFNDDNMSIDGMDGMDTFSPVKSVGGTPIKGPTDKQIEIKTSDGRRRITPMFIVPTMDHDGNSMSMSSDSFNKLSSSSSLEAKSKIKIERLEGVIKPNVSPGKNSLLNGEQKPVVENGDVKQAVNQIQIKRKIGTNIVPVKSQLLPTTKTSTSSNDTSGASTPNGPSASKAPASNGPKAPASNGPKAQATNGPKAPVTNGLKDASTFGTKPAEVDQTKKDDKEPERTKKPEKSKNDEDNIRGKKPANRIEDSSSSSGSSSDSSDSSDSSSEDDETASQTEKSGKSDADDKVKKCLPTKISVVGTKRKGDDISAQQAKKRGRPLGAVQTKPDSGTVTPTVKVTAPPETPAPSILVQPAPQPRLPPSPVRTPGLPPLCIPRNPYYLQLRTTDTILHLHIQNDYEKYVGGSVHRVAVHLGESTTSTLAWESLFTAPLAGAVAGGDLVVLVCRDATFHLFNPDGSRALPTLTLPSPAHRLKNEGSKVLCITTLGRVFVWNMATNPPKSILKDVEITPLNRHTSPKTSKSISRLEISTTDSMPVISLSDGSSHTYSNDLGCWLQLTDSRAALSLSTAMSRGPPNTLPLAALTSQPTGMSKLDATTAATWTVSVIETKISASLYLKSPQEYRYWLLRLVKALTSAGLETRLRAILNDLNATTPRNGSIGSGSEALGLSRRTLMTAVLPIVAGNLALQRLYSEYRNTVELKSSGSMDLFAEK